jgi:hypothetical protein
MSFLFLAIWPVMIGGQPPEFDSKPINVTAIKGQPAVLPCTVINKNDYLVSSIFFQKSFPSRKNNDYTNIIEILLIRCFMSGLYIKFD